MRASSETGPLRAPPRRAPRPPGRIAHKRRCALLPRRSRGDRRRPLRRLTRQSGGRAHDLACRARRGRRNAHRHPPWRPRTTSHCPKRRPVMFKQFNQSELQERASEDARLGIYEPDAYITATIGPEPSFDPVGNLRHANVGSRLQNPTVEETEADMRREEDEMARHPSAHLLLTFLMILLFMECAGA